MTSRPDELRDSINTMLHNLHGYCEHGVYVEEADAILDLINQQVAATQAAHKKTLLERLQTEVTNLQKQMGSNAQSVTLGIYDFIDEETARLEPKSAEEGK